MVDILYDSSGRSEEQLRGLNRADMTVYLVQLSLNL